MNVTSLNLSRQLYERFKWELDEDGLYIEKFYWTTGDKNVQPKPIEVYKLIPQMRVCPAYDLDYLRQKALELIGSPSSDLADDLARALLDGCDSTAQWILDTFPEGEKL